MSAIMDLIIFILQDTYNKSTSLDTIANSINYPSETINEILMNLYSNLSVESITTKQVRFLKVTL